MMNLYKFHANPEKLDSYERRLEIPSYAYEYGKSNGFTDELISAVAKDAETAVRYAYVILKKPWHEAPGIDPNIARQAELTIAKDATEAVEYARILLKEPWHETDIDPDITGQAEEIIATDSWSAYRYARHILEEPWSEYPDIDPGLARQAEETIAAGSGMESGLYAHHFGIKL